MDVTQNWQAAATKAAALVFIILLFGREGLGAAILGYAGSILLIRLLAFDGQSFWVPREAENTIASGAAMTLVLLTVLFSPYGWLAIAGLFALLYVMQRMAHRARI